MRRPLEHAPAGEQLMRDVFDLLAERVPDLPLDDPTRPALMRLLPDLAKSLGRDEFRFIKAVD